MRTVIYARFSSDRQNPLSAEDQIALCRERCEREGWPVVGVHSDEAIGGAAGFDESQRPGINALLAQVKAGGVDQVLAESTSRVARHLVDSPAIRALINHAGARLFTLAQGDVDDFKGTIQGLVDAQGRKDIAFNVRRGQASAVRRGRSPAGLAYGYRRAPRLDDRGDLIRGERAIDPEKAEIVRRIFMEIAAGASARAVAAGLNRDGIPGPRGGKWRTSTLLGDRKRRNGMLQNRLYKGELVHARTSKVTEPTTRKTRIRPNPEAEWIVQPVPELAILDAGLWDRVQEMRAIHAAPAPHLARRPKRLLSGLAVCGICGGGWTVIGRERWGCGRYRDGRGCTNNRTVTTKLLETRVLLGLGERMLDPEVARAYVRTFHKEHARRAGDVERAKARLERKLAEANAKIGRLVEAFGERGGDIEEVRAVLTAARVGRDAVQAQLRNIEAIPILALHPGLADDYRRRMALLGKGEPIAPEQVPIIRGLIDRVVVVPDPKRDRGTSIEVTGRLASILALAAGEPLAAHMYANGGAGSADQPLTDMLLRAVV